MKLIADPARIKDCKEHDICWVILALILLVFSFQPFLREGRTKVAILRNFRFNTYFAWLVFVNLGEGERKWCFWHCLHHWTCRRCSQKMVHLRNMGGKLHPCLAYGGPQLVYRSHVVLPYRKWKQMICIVRNWTLRRKTRSWRGHPYCHRRLVRWWGKLTLVLLNSSYMWRSLLVFFSSDDDERFPSPLSFLLKMNNFLHRSAGSRKRRSAA